MRSNIFKLADEDGNVYWGKIFLFFIALMIVATGLVVAGRYIGTAAGWISMPAEKLSSENVQKEFEWFYGMHQQIRANRKTIASLKAQRTELFTLNGQNVERWSFTAKEQYSQINKQILQVETALNVACGEYSAKWDNVFHSMAAPANVPRSCEDIE